MTSIQNKIFSILEINLNDILKEWVDRSVDFSQKLSNSTQNKFDSVELQKLNESNLYRIVLRNNYAEQIDTEFIESLISLFENVLGKDECNLGAFNKIDKEQFEKKSWLGRVWMNFHTQNLSLVLFRSEDIFELRIITFIADV